MIISELKAGQGKVDIEVVVKSKEAPRIMNKYGKELKVANAVVEDESGEIKLTLWNQDVDKVNVGNKVKITNGYISEFNGEKQLTSGKFGKLEVVGPSGSSAEESAASEPAPQKEKPKKEKVEKNPKIEESGEEELEEENFEEDTF